DVFPFFSPGSFQFRSNQCRQLLQPFSKRRNKQGEAVESLIQVLSKFPQPHPFSQRTVGRADDSRIRSEHSLRAEALKLAVFQNAQDLYLREGTHFRDFIQKKRAFIGKFELSFNALLCAGKSSAFVTKQLTFEQRVANRRSIECNERAICSR